VTETEPSTAGSVCAGLVEMGVEATTEPPPEPFKEAPDTGSGQLKVALMTMALPPLSSAGRLRLV
jgi:hypothetical protein